MSEILNETEVRVLGSLVEKQLTTPEYYPLTMNALIAACNQKSNREPVMSLDEDTIAASLDTLRDKNLVYLFHGSTSRVVKYKHMLPGVYELDPARDRGDCRSDASRAANRRRIRAAAPTECMNSPRSARCRKRLILLSAASRRWSSRLERQPGQKDARYAHLLSGEIDSRT